MTNRHFRKRPVVIEAVQNTGGSENLIELARWMGDWFISPGPEGEIYMSTFEGMMRADVDDWIIKGVENEFYPCKPSVFEASYEPVYDNDEDVYAVMD